MFPSLPHNLLFGNNSLTRLGSSFSEELIDLFIKDPNKAIFVAQLLNERGEIVLDIDDTEIVRDDTEFSGVVVEHDSQFTEGKYQVKVILQKDNYNSNLFISDNTTKTIEVQYVLTEQFSWNILEPKADPDGKNPYDLHPVLGWYPDPEDLPMSIELSRINGDDLSPKDVMLDTEVALFSGELFEQGVDEPHEILFVWNEEKDTLISNWPSEADTEGYYEIKNVSVITDTHRASWQPISGQSETIGFWRQNSLLRKPWMLPYSSFAFLFIVLIGIVVYNLSNRPLGVVSFIDPKTSVILHDEVMGRPIKGWFKTYRSTDDGLATLDLEKIVVRKLPKDEDDKRTVEIELFDADGESLVSEIMITGEIFNHYYTYESEGEEIQAMVDVKYE